MLAVEPILQDFGWYGSRMTSRFFAASQSVLLSAIVLLPAVEAMAGKRRKKTVDPWGQPFQHPREAAGEKTISSQIRIGQSHVVAGISIVTREVASAIPIAQHGCKVQKFN